jgi:uncharacterized membrane-anchored protein YitT (DUF2179 family)
MIAAAVATTNIGQNRGAGHHPSIHTLHNVNLRLFAWKKISKKNFSTLTTPQTSLEMHKNSSETYMGLICRMFEKYFLGVLTSMQPVKLPTPPPPPTHLIGINGIR